jgi:ABC-2 type transport system permease protein
MLKKEFKQIFRTKEMLAIIFIMPIIQMTVLGFAITNEVKHIKLIVADHDKSKISREIVALFLNTDRFTFVSEETDFKNVEESLFRWEAQMALVIPSGFQRDLMRNTNPEIQLIVDGLDGNTAGIALGYARGMIQAYAEQLLREPHLRIAHRLVPVGATPSDAFPVEKPHLVTMLQRTWFNLNLENAQYMVPGIVALLLTILSMMLSSISLVREREVGTLEQLMVTPMKRYQLLLGKLLPFLLLAFVEFFIVLLLAQVIFPIKMQGSYVLLGVMALLYLFTTLGLGVLISTITSTQQQAFFVSWFFLVFMIMMSGLFIPIENMPPVLQKLTYLNPLRYFMALVRDIFQKGITLPHTIYEALPMTVLGVLIFSFSVMHFQKRIS